MDAAASATPGSARLRAALGPLAARWAALAPRERRLLAALGLVLLLVLLWFVFIAPAWKVVRAAPARLDQLDVQMQQMQRLAAEARGLRDAPQVGVPQSQAAVKAATEGLEGKARLLLSGDRATATFTNVDSGDLRDWLAEVRAAARARPIEVNLTRGPQGLSGTVILALPGAAP